MESLSFKVGCNFDRALLGGLAELNAVHGERRRVVELFGSMPGVNPIGTARPDFRLKDGDVGSLASFVNDAASHGMKLNYTLNTPLADPRKLDEGRREIAVFFNRLEEMGVARITVANPLVARIVQEMCDVPIELSTIMQLRDPWQLEELKERCPSIDKLCMDVFANRDFAKIRSFVEKGDEIGVAIEVLVNEFCIHECVDRRPCYDIHAMNLSDDERRLWNNYPMGNCISKRIREPVEWLRARFVLPQWIDTYAAMGVSSFKVSGRTHPTSYILWVTDKYLAGYYGGNLLALWANVENIGRPEDAYKGPRVHIKTNAVPIDFLEWYNDNMDNDEYGYLERVLESAVVA